MKYGLLTIGVIAPRQEEKSINIGDIIQTIAVASLYKKMKIPQEEIIEININDIMDYDGEYVVLPININLSLNFCMDFFPLPPKIIPVFLGLSYFSVEEIPASLIDYFKTYAPIGCRDESTLKLMRKYGIPSYLFGCMTATLPRRTNDPENGKIFLVDVPESALPYIPEKLRKKAEMISHIYHGEKLLDIQNVYDAGYKLLEKYRTQADLIITARLHCLSPCLAMGIPIIAMPDNRSPRMAWIDRLVHIYSPDEYEKIDWEPKSVDYEETKNAMIQVAAARIQETFEKYRSITEISYFYECREKCEYGTLYSDVLRQLPDNIGDSFEYILWGAGQIGINAYQVISKKYPRSKLVGVIDSFCNGQFLGLKIEKPDVLTIDTKAYIFIATYSGESCAVQKLSELNKLFGKDYLSFATKTG